MPEGGHEPYGDNVSDKLHFGMSFSAVGHEFSVNESIVYMK